MFVLVRRKERGPRRPCLLGQWIQTDGWVAEAVILGHVLVAPRSQGAALVSIVGIVDTDGFRDLVLEQRDRIADRDDGPEAAAPASDPVRAGAAAAPGSDPALLATLTEIRDVLQRIESAVSNADRSG
jgi:hypothetical protein